MFEHTNALLTIGIEILIGAVIFLVVRLVFAGRLKKKLEDKIVSQQNLIEELQQKQSKVPHSPSASTDLTPEDQTTITHYKQRIKNLEKFRKLYFEIEKHLDAELHKNKETTEKLDKFKNLIERQESLIESLKQNISQISEKYSITQSALSSTEQTITELSETAENLRDELKTERARSIQTNLLQKEIDHYRDRVTELEEHERYLKKQSESYKNELEQMHKNFDKPHPYGEVKIYEIKKLEENLEKKESEIVHLREECDTIAKQYEKLATNSLKSIEELERASREEQINLQQMQFILEKNAKALAQKQAECQTLENLCMKLKNAVPKEMEDILKASLKERDEIQDAIFDIGRQAATLTGSENHQKMDELENKLRATGESLASKRDRFLDMKSQALQSDPNNYSQALQLENEKLKIKIRNAERLQQAKKQKDQEIENLRNELTMLEDKYLLLLDKTNGDAIH